MVVDRGAFEFGALPPSNTPADFDNDGDVWAGWVLLDLRRVLTARAIRRRESVCPQF